MEGNPMNPAEKLRKLMREHGIDKRLKEKEVEGPLAPAPEDGHRIDVSYEQKPLRDIHGVMKDAKAHERRNTLPKEDDSSENTK